jgi:tetraacyldisaccharide 4'-kinase
VKGARLVHWLWQAGPAAALTRLPLVPLALLYGATMRLRAAAYRRGLLATQPLPLPAVAVGNLSVGGTGKTPLAAWIARHYAGRGRTPGILLRGYGADEPLVHRRLVPEAVVVPHRDRAAGAAQARAAGADVLVLDDAFQLLAVARDLNVVVVSAESVAGSPWPLPAGPWREGWHALARADVIVVTRKHAAADAAAALAQRLEERGQEGTGRRPLVCLAHLVVSELEGMRSGARTGLQVLGGRRVLAAAGIADPESFAAQLRGLGAMVQLQAYQDHHAYGRADIARLVRGSAAADYVVITEKDAVKLRGRWPEEAPEPLVAGLSVRWERNGVALERALDAVLASAGRP